MLTTVYYLQGTPDTTFSIKQILDFLGGNTPLPSDLQGDETGPRFLLCVDSTVSISQFCGSNGYSVESTSPFEAEDSRYNSTYRIIIQSAAPEEYALVAATQ